MKLFFIFLFSKCDNFELSKSDFKELIINELRIESKSLAKNEHIKFSFPGYYSYKLKKVNDNFLFQDDTVYLKNAQKTPTFRIDIEIKAYGLTMDTWRLVFSILSLTIVNLIFYCFIILNLIFLKRHEKIE